MILRALAVLATVAVPAAALVVGGGLPPWVLPVVAAALVGPILVARRGAFLSILIGAGLAALSANTTVEAAALIEVTADPDSWPHYDLTEASLGEEARGFVVVEGYYRGEWTLDEYRVESGERPDQNQAAAYELIPLLGSRDAVVVPEGRIVIARVPKKQAHATALTRARGKLEPLPEGILDSLVTFDPKLPKDRVSGVMLDTVEVPTRQQAWTQAALALIASLLALALLWLAIRGEGKSDEASAPGDETG